MADEMKNVPDLSALLGELLANKELMEKIGEIAGTAKSTEQAPTPDTILQNADIMSKLPEVMSVITPLINGEAKSDSNDGKRLALLYALKPYLSPKRCEAIDYIARMSKLSQTFKGLKL